MKRVICTCLILGLCSSASADVVIKAVSATEKVLPQGKLATAAAEADLWAGRNEFEAFQIVIQAAQPLKGITVKIEKNLSDGAGELAATHLTFYRVDYYNVQTASNSESKAGPWPDPLIPMVDTYVGETRNGFPFDIKANARRAIWVDIFVPPGTAPGVFKGAIAIYAADKKLATVPVSLKVGDFELPSTASLASAFGLDYEQPCKAHTGYASCSKEWNERGAYLLRERYLRSGLEHRFTIHDAFFEPPFESKAFDQLVMPLIDGSAKNIRLRGAKLTSLRLAGELPDLKKWVAFAKKRGFFDRLFAYPVDEPDHEDLDGKAEWAKLKTYADALHKIDPAARIIITAPIQRTNQKGLTEAIDIFVPLINHIEDRPSNGPDYAGNQRPKYDAWLAGKKTRRLWSYQSCMSHGCGDCNAPSPERVDTGWPNRVIDSSGVQNRVFPWHAFLYDISGELYFEVSEQLTTAWDANGQCKFSGSGDGTLFYPGTPKRIGGKTDIPIESVRIKLIREGMEDYEYLKLAAAKAPKKTREIALALFPKSFRSHRSPQQLEHARRQLFALIDAKTDLASVGPAPKVDSKFEVANDEGWWPAMVARYGRKRILIAAAAAGGLVLAALFALIRLRKRRSGN